jgi:WD40 repeat protein
MAFSPDHAKLITASADRSIKLWDLEGALIRSFNHHTEAVHTLAVRPRSGGSPLECASGSDDRTVRIWQPAIGRMVRIIRGHDGPIFATGYAPDGSALYSAGKEGVLRKLDVDSDEILAEKRVSTDVIYSLAIAPCGQRIAIGDWSGRVKIWDAALK